VRNYTWYSNSGSLESADTIHQILAFGTLSDFRELKAKVGEQKLQKIFVTYPKKVYTPQSLSFIMRFILHISDPVDERRYLKHTPRYPR